MTIRNRISCFVISFAVTGIAMLSVDASAEVKSTRRPAQAVKKSAKTSASAKGSTAAKTGTTVAVVVSEESQIYDKPDLDGAVVTVVKRGKRLPVSKGTRGEFAKFYRTRANGKLGWILTSDVKSEVDAKKFFTQAKAAAYKRGPFEPEADEVKGSSKEMFAFTRSVAFAVGQNEYKESINGVDYTANLLTYGLKLTGPDVLLTGPLMDVNILLHYGAPEYYKGLSQIAPTGFILWTDANLLLPIIVRQDTLIGIGAGPILVISNIQASQGTTDYGMWAFNIGVDVELTAGIRFDDFCIRLDGKYIFEKKTYRQVQLSVGTIF